MGNDCWQRTVCLSDRATNAPKDIFHFNEGFLCEEHSVPLTQDKQALRTRGFRPCGGPTGGILCLTQNNSSLSQRRNTIRPRDGEPKPQNWLTVPHEVVAGEKVLWKWLSLVESVDNTRSTSVSLSMSVRLKLNLTSQFQSVLHEQTLLMVTSASVTSSQHSKYQENALRSNNSSPHKTPANHSPLRTIQTQSLRIFFFLNIVKSNTSSSCTHLNCQTMFVIFPLLVAHWWWTAVRRERQRILRV